MATIATNTVEPSLPPLHPFRPLFFCAALAASLGMLAWGMFLQFGYPGENWSDIEQTLQLARELEPADIGVSVSYPLPGTGFYERVRQELGVKQNWVDSNDLSTMYKATYAPEVYRRVHELVHHEFRARKSAHSLTSLTQQPWAFRPAHVKKMASWAYNRIALEVTRQRLRPVRTA